MEIIDSLSLGAMSHVVGGQDQRPTKVDPDQKFEFHGNQDGYKIGPVYLT